MILNYPVQSLQGSFFLTVISWTSKPDGILAQLQFGLPAGQKYRIVKKLKKNVRKLNSSD